MFIKNKNSNDFPQQQIHYKFEKKYQPKYDTFRNHNISLLKCTLCEVSAREKSRGPILRIFIYDGIMWS